MSDLGFYCGWAEFSVIIPKGDPMLFRLHFHGQASHGLCRRYGLRDYLEDILSESLRPLCETT